jgi:predicted nucleotidyltransferase
MSEIGELARALGADERTMRRFVEDGTVRCERLGPRRRRIDERERAYLLSHWPLLSGVRRVLRTETNVRLAVLYGSAARGQDAPDSDVDLLVSLAKDRPGAAVGIAVRLERALGCEVDVARLNRVSVNAPLLLLAAIDEGRVVLDRDRQWPRLCADRAEIEHRAQAAHVARRRRAQASVRELLSAEAR